MPIAALSGNKNARARGFKRAHFHPHSTTDPHDTQDVQHFTPKRKSTVRRGAVRRGVVRRGAVRRGVVRRGVVRRGAVRRGAVRRGAVRRGAVRS